MSTINSIYIILYALLSFVGLACLLQKLETKLPANIKKNKFVASIIAMQHHAYFISALLIAPLTYIRLKNL